MKLKTNEDLKSKYQGYQSFEIDEAILKNPFINLVKSNHPIFGFFHLALKVAPIFSYLFMGIFQSSIIMTFIMTLVISCFDFWFVKNIAGRYMLGMRWWNGDDDLGRDGWVFDSYDNADCSTEFDRNVFWNCLRGSIVFWGVMVITKTLSFSFFWGILVIVIFLLNLTNYYGYTMCYKDQAKKLNSIANLYGKIYQTMRGDKLKG